jgi:hypothetical protein
MPAWRDTSCRQCDCLVVGTAGSVSTGAVDPLPEISALCKEYDLWSHVDGAYGGFAAAVPQGHDDLRGLSLADSVAVDPHKWLYAPLEAGCALVRDPERLRAAFAVSPSLLPFRGVYNELCRLWSPEPARLPCPESLACPKAGRSRGVSQHDRGGYTPVSGNGTSGQPPCGTAAYDLGIKHSNLRLRVEQSSSKAARIRG